MMYSFRNDYSEGAHPKVLQALTDTNLEQTGAAWRRRTWSGSSARLRRRTSISWWGAPRPIWWSSSPS